MPRYIDADKVLQYPLRRDRCDKEHANPHFTNGVESVVEYIEYLAEEEPADVQEVRHGKWIIDGITPYCSICRQPSEYYCDGEHSTPLFCPNCGAKMKVVEK